MGRALAVPVLGICGVLFTPTGAFAAPASCHLAVLLELPVTMRGPTPLTDIKVDGHDLSVIVDSGAFYSLLSPAAAAEFGLPLKPTGIRASGIAGELASLHVTSVSIALGGITISKKVDFLVGGTDLGGGVRGMLGQNILSIADVEYDFAHGVLRLIEANDQCRQSMNAPYWAKGGEAYSVMDITKPTPFQPFIKGSAYLNGSRIDVVFDTGSPTSLTSLHAAERAGVKPDAPGVKPGAPVFGVGRGAFKSWIVPFQSFKIGDEEIRNTHLRVGDSRLMGLEDMLIGADFFLSHRVYVSNSQHKLYFTYNGGPVFNLSTEEGTAVAQNPNTTTDSPQAQENNSGSSDGDEPDTDELLAGNAGAVTRNTTIPEGEPTTAEEFYRRGAAYLSRRDFSHALSDEQRACQLNPQESKYFFERALVYWRSGQLQLSDIDVDTALKLKPDDLNARLWRAWRELSRKDKPSAIADLDEADRLAAPQEGVRLEMAELYRSSGQLPQAIKQYSVWIDTHHQDNALGWAYRSRCLTRAIAGQELEEALSDCNRILYHSSKANPEALADRGLVYLRLGKFESAISDYSGALKQQPKNAWALYGRGLAETQLKKTEAAQADINAATALSPHIAEEFTKRGIAP